jgi:DNA-binding transcriptional LysR family regulator
MNLFHLGLAVFSKLPLKALRSFESAARLSSFRLAADELAVTPSAISHQVKALEAWLGRRLFDRTPVGVQLTPEGAVLFTDVHRYFLDLARSLAQLRPAAIQQTVVVTTTAAFAALWLIPRLGSFYAAHPQITVKVEAANDVIDLARNASVDIAIRNTRKQHSDLYQALLLDEHFGVFIAPGTVPATAELINVAWTPPQTAGVEWRDWCGAAGLDGWLADYKMRDYEDEHYALQAAVAGQGYLLASTVLAADSVARGTLMAYRPEVTLQGASYYVLARPGRERVAPVMEFVRWLGDLGPL